MTADRDATHLRPGERMRRSPALCLQEDAVGGALVVDDRSFTAAHVNQAAWVVLQALAVPRTRDELATVLAKAAQCEVREAEESLAGLLAQFAQLDWICAVGEEDTRPITSVSPLG